MDFSIIIPTFNRESILRSTLESISFVVEELNGEIIVVNDYHVPLSITGKDGITILKNPRKGVASARNYGAEHAKSDFLIFMDDDFLVDKESIELIIKLSHMHPDKIFLLNWEYPEKTLKEIKKQKFGRFLIYYNWTSLKGWLGKKEWNSEQPFMVTNGASYFLPLFKSDFESIGGYNEQFPFAGFEDYDFCKRIMQIGKIFYIYPQKTILHNESDRVLLESFLNRRKRDATTRRFAYEIGYSELELKYSYFKRIILFFLSVSRKMFLLIAKLIPNKNEFDYFYYKVVNLLIAIEIYNGYNEFEKKNQVITSNI